ncbi:hypothetical protein K505DRAFT_340697 [Melanomma pulvis-pyrius CBS 109.77]|uniref:Uncharacterized protein n=1 Tax=Melanomma pulvis-pyrius CBS 109.77 TaxID=1314802 RepID=A0A6A6X0X1_9PLEO|nr:hypothetical protein K505DRAFT_340697 [Melanomma pulvis-pyrius CBS 109.77]
MASAMRKTKDSAGYSRPRHHETCLPPSPDKDRRAGTPTRIPRNPPMCCAVQPAAPDTQLIRAWDLTRQRPLTALPDPSPTPSRPLPNVANLMSSSAAGTPHCTAALHRPRARRRVV